MTAILFDVDDTLYNQLAPFEQAYQKNFYSENIDIKELFRVSRRYSDKVFEASQTGIISMEDMYIYRLQKAFAHFGREITASAALAFQKDYSYFQQQINLLPDVKKTLDYCKAQGIKIGIITNGPRVHQVKKSNS